MLKLLQWVAIIGMALIVAAYIAYIIVSYKVVISILTIISLAAFIEI